MTILSTMNTAQKTEFGNAVLSSFDTGVPGTDLVYDKTLESWYCNFNEGLEGFKQLIDGTRPRGQVYLTRKITAPGSKFGMRMQTASQPDAGLPYGMCMAIRRMSRGLVASKIYQSYTFGWGARFSANPGDGSLVSFTPRALQWGFDQCHPTTYNRLYPKVRWLHFDQAAAGTDGEKRRCQFQIQVQDLVTDPTGATGIFVDVPGVIVDFGYNENKQNLNVVEMLFDIDAGKYLGLRVNGRSFGYFLSPSDTSLSALGSIPILQLKAFAGGANTTMEVLNRTDSWVTSEAWAVVTESKGGWVK